MGQKTSLYQQHVAMGGKMVDFAGWEMPINYGSQVEEHHQVRNDAGMFDVSHMTVVDIKGEQVKALLSELLANDIARLKSSGKALYSCMLNEQAGVIDDLIVYFMNDNWYRMVVNAATRDKDLAWIEQQASRFSVSIEEQQLSMIAVQGPNARQKANELLPTEIRGLATDLAPFFACHAGEMFIGRTGYTGEDGYEIILPHEDAPNLWQALANNGVKPIGLGARDTLRLEAGMNLYGQDMDENTNPLESGLSWTVAWSPEERNFIGRNSLEQIKQTPNTRKFVGLVLNEKGIMRTGQTVLLDDSSEGIITSGGFSPTLQKSIAFARVPANIGSECKIEIRNKQLSAAVVKPQFVRNGKSCL